MTTQRLRPWLIAGGIALLCLLVFLGIRHVLQNAEKPKRPTIAQIELLRPPPPPPPPKVEEKPPEPQVKEEVKLDEPTPQDEPQEQAENNDEPPPSENLGVDAEGGAGTDGFGLVGNKGGANLIGSGGGSKFRWYARQVEQQLQSKLADDERLKRLNYRVTVMFWLSPSGLVERYELDGSTGNSDIDRALRQALADLRGFGQAPPEGMPQPVGLRINSRT